MLVLSGCDAALCNPEQWCDGTVTVRCDVVCTGGGTLPKECRRELNRFDCAGPTQTAALGVARTCRVFNGNAVCVDDPVTRCTSADPNSCTSTGALTHCTEFYEPANRYRDTSRCSPTAICVEDGLCVDEPVVHCDADSGYPRCKSETQRVVCDHSYELTIPSSAWTDGGG